jgi:hypothetical protein
MNKVSGESAAYPSVGCRGVDTRTYIATEIASGLASVTLEHVQEAAALVDLTVDQVIARAAVRITDALLAELNR